MNVRGKSSHFFRAHPPSHDLQVAKLCINTAISPTNVSACITQIIYDWRNVRHVVLVRRQADAAGRLVFLPFYYFFFYLGLKFNCVFAVSAVAPVSDGTDV